MTDDMGGSPIEETESEGVRLLKDFVVPGVWIGYVLAVAGVIIGIALAAKRHEVACDEPHQCYAHPQALQGLAIVVIAAMLGILIGIAGAIARAILDDRRAATS